ncbi:MAG: tRNA (N6-isopentenyl adenosine(37)-C2)-methylthiotransferase MiaB [Nevskiaceae bacterium]|nr:MAG: tRNA (N6-isopentenyl adenosine(37)-C2)-methylthiotransferase MiaB [Nevskiaceae bacterium]TBR73069.1 MAG: tRNA (N6-isopentenyl adenosine(37)-C2)-methylthiotransferase MiaB [Nevskiaceae bacterium]
MPKLYIKTFGCQMNEYDSGKMADVLREAEGYERTEDPDAADLILLNTCSIREKAQEKVFSELGRWTEWKAAAPGRLIGVGGCVASQEGEALAKRAGNVDVVFGPQTLHRLPKLLKQTRTTHQPAVDVTFPEIEKFDHLPAPRAEGPTAFVSIMEGCSKYCSYCIVPYTRGEEVSRPLVDVLAEVEQLADQDVREITLLGQNVNAYRGPTPDGEVVDLAFLIACIARIDTIGRIRFTTSHPAEFTDALIEAYATEPKLAGYLHLPVQSGSDRILGMMKRGYTAAQYVEKIDRLRAVQPGIALSTDFIVGFPGETDADFEQTMALIERCRFDAAFSFIYSARPGTPAARLRELPAEVTKARLERLQTRIRELGATFAQDLIGTTQRVLVERRSRRESKNHLAGRAACNRWVNFACPAEDAERLIGRFVDVEITEAAPNSLRGQLATAVA